MARLAPCYIRFGHFDLSHHRGDATLLKEIADFVIRHYYQEEINQRKASSPPEEGNDYMWFLRLVIERTAALIAKWQAVGFVHGVLNTDNLSIIGLTIDFGPFGFLNRFDPNYTPNTYDAHKRYTFSKQAEMAVWDLHKLADALAILIKRDNP